MDKLAEQVVSMLGHRHVHAEISVHVGNGKLLAYLASNARILEKRYEDDYVVMQVSMPRLLLARIAPSEATIRLQEADAPMPTNLDDDPYEESSSE
jgi:hypothetical protein